MGMHMGILWGLFGCFFKILFLLFSGFFFIWRGGGDW